jgi:hypothetical protein
MSEDIPPLPQYAFMAWCLVKAQGQLYFYHKNSIAYSGGKMFNLLQVRISVYK